MLDGSELDFIDKQVRKFDKGFKKARVTQVYEHLQNDDESNFECDVDVDGGTFEERVKPVTGGWADQIAVPKVGDTVLLLYRHGESKDPVIARSVSTENDAPPRGRAGMFRDKYDAPGSENVFVTRYTEYDSNPALNDKSDLSAVETAIQIAKQEESSGTTDADSAKLLIELLDTTKSGNDTKVDLTANDIGSDDDSLSVELNVDDGTLKIRGNTSSEFGLKLDLSDGSFKILDEEGYGIVSDGAGNFDWYYESLDEIQGQTTSF